MTHLNIYPGIKMMQEFNSWRNVHQMKALELKIYKNYDSSQLSWENNWAFFQTINNMSVCFDT